MAKRDGLSDFFQRLTRQGRRASGRAHAPGEASTSRFEDLLRDVVDRTRRSTKRISKKTSRRVRKEAPPGATVRIEYTPNLDGDPDPGEVVWAWVPYEDDPTQGKDRPVVIIGRRGPNLVGVPLTSRRNDREAQVAVGTGAWDSKRRPSYARIWRMLDLDDRAVRREGSILDRGRFDDVIDAVERHYEVVGG